jgi:hypothetical protein
MGKSTVQFSFGQIEAVCADLNNIASDKRVAFMGRMKQLQKWGLTKTESRPGRGKAGTYGFADLMRFVIGIELIQAGMMPQRAARTVSGSWNLLRTSIYLCSFAPEDTIGHSAPPVRHLWMLDIQALQPLTHRGVGEYDDMERINAVPIEEAAKELERGVSRDPETFGEAWRTLVLNGHNLTQRVMKNIAFHFGWFTRQELRDDLQAEIDAHNEELRRFSETLKEMDELPQEKREEAARKLREMFNADYSTNPPTPRSVYVERAKDMMRFLTPDIRAFLSGPEPDRFRIDEGTKPMLKQLIDLGVIEITLAENEEGYDLQSINLTPFGEVLVEEFGGEWGEKIAQRRERENPFRRQRSEEGHGDNQEA